MLRNRLKHWKFPWRNVWPQFDSVKRRCVRDVKNPWPHARHGMPHALSGAPPSHIADHRFHNTSTITAENHVAENVQRRITTPIHHGLCTPARLFRPGRTSTLNHQNDDSTMENRNHRDSDPLSPKEFSGNGAVADIPPANTNILTMGGALLEFGSLRIPLAIMRIFFMMHNIFFLTFMTFAIL